MRTFLAAATGLPTILLTAALVVMLCFWFLVAAGFTTTYSFDADLDLRAWGMGGVPVTIAISSVIVLAWGMGVGGTLVLVVFTSPGPVTGLLRMVVPVLALLAAWQLTRLLVRPLQRLFPDEPGLVSDRGRTPDRNSLDHAA